MRFSSQIQYSHGKTKGREITRFRAQRGRAPFVAGAGAADSLPCAVAPFGVGGPAAWELRRGAARRRPLFDFTRGACASRTGQKHAHKERSKNEVQDV